jgi:hypothetical protein
MPHLTYRRRGGRIDGLRPWRASSSIEQVRSFAALFAPLVPHRLGPSLDSGRNRNGESGWSANETPAWKADVGISRCIFSGSGRR